MKRFYGSLLGGLFMGALALGLSTTAQAQNYPSKPITVVCNFPAGTGADIYVRYFSNKLQEVLKQTVITENKGGASGNIGTNYAAQQKGDGYTILISPGSSTMAAAQSLFKQLPFNPDKDFIPVTTLVHLGFVIVVDAKSPYKTLNDLTEAMKKKGDKGAYGSGSNTGLVSGELYKAGYGLQTKVVNYTDAMAGQNDLLGGILDFQSIDSAFAKGQVSDGKIRALAQTSSFRATGFENVPTMKEAGVPGFEKIEPWWAVYVPKGTPQPIVDKLEKTFNDIVKMPETKTFFNNLGGDPYPGDHALLAKIQKEEAAAWPGYMKLAKIEAQ